MHMKLCHLLFKTGVDFDVNSISALVSYHIVELFPVANIALNYYHPPVIMSFDLES